MIVHKRLAALYAALAFVSADQYCNTGATGSGSAIGAMIRPISITSADAAASSLQEEKDLILTYTSAGYVSFTMNLLASLQRVEISRVVEVVVLTLDKKSYDQLCALHVPCWYSTTLGEASGASAQTTRNDIAHFGSEQFNRLSQQKMTAIHSLLGRGYNVFATDGDIAWKRDPFPSLAAFTRPLVRLVLSPRRHARTPDVRG